MLCDRLVAVTVISVSASELTSVIVWSAAAALKEAPPKIDAIAIESLEFISHPLIFF
jgi:hypothetical protein